MLYQLSMLLNQSLLKLLLILKLNSRNTLKQPSLEEQLELSLDTLETFREKSAIDKNSSPSMACRIKSSP